MSSIDLSRFFANPAGNAIGDAFPSRRAVMPWRNRRPLDPGASADLWPRLLAECGAPRRRLVYVHVPFCANHCLFCGFYRNAYTPADGAVYADRLIAEVEREASEAGVAHHPVEAVYLGGGTPSALTADELARIVSALRKNLPLAPDCEITLEGRIIHFDEDKLDACIEAGVNRISVGVQTFDTALRQRQGRRASREEAIRFLAGVRSRGRVALVIDLLYGLPGQTPDMWREDLRIVADLAPDGVDLYGLNLIPGTPLQRAVSAGKFAPATYDELGAMYEAGATFLGAQGWRQISNSHWARTPRERNIYNLRIKQGADCLAYGSGAGGVLGRYSYSIVSDIAQYGAGVDAGRKPLGGMSVSDDVDAARQYVTAGFEVGLLDLRGLDVPQVPEAKSQFLSLLEQWRSAGLLRIEQDMAHLTLAGRFWYSNLIAAFNDIIAGPADELRRAPAMSQRHSPSQHTGRLQ